MSNISFDNFTHFGKNHRDFAPGRSGWMKNKVKFIITHVSHKRIDTFMFRIYDPIRDYIEENFRITYHGKYFFLWELKEQI